ncbi:unnamed protein product [Cunninghamella blakesleeana]
MTNNNINNNMYTMDMITELQRQTKDITLDHSFTFMPELILSNLLQTQCNLPPPPSSPIIIQPIHHTLENATITYDTNLVLDQPHQQKELVKDVFFSPAMIQQSNHHHHHHHFHHHTMNNNINNNHQQKNQQDAIENELNPSDLLLEQDDDTSSLLFFGALDIDLDNHSLTSPTSTSFSHDNNLILKHKKNIHNNDLLETQKKRDQWLTVTPKSTPPMSPYEQSWDYFDNSGEDSSSDDESNTSNLDFQTINSNFQSISVQESSYDFNNQVEKDEFMNLEKNQHPHKKNKLSKQGRPSNKKNRLTTSNPIKKPKLPKKPKQPKKSKLINTATVSSSNNSSPLVHTPENNDNDHLEKVDPRPTHHPTLYEKLTGANMDWCRYCGTTEGVNWRPGPWGKRTLCNKHGCDYKGYGFACKLPRLDLTGYLNESIHDRDRPVLQFYCATCHQKESWETNVLVRCEGCYKSFHQKCYHGDEQALTDEFVSGDQPWYCDATCRDNVLRQKVVVEISRKRLPLMCAPTKNQIAAAVAANNSNNNHINNNNHSSTNRTTRAIRDISK